MTHENNIDGSFALARPATNVTLSGLVYIDGTPEMRVALTQALAKAYADIENPLKDSINPHFRSKYADLASVLDTIRAAYAKHGLSLVQFPGGTPEQPSVETVVFHSGGAFLRGPTVTCKPTKSDPQGVGAAITYLRRYGAAAVAGVFQEDDDGETAAGRGTTKREAPVLPAEKKAWAAGVTGSLDMQEKAAKVPPAGLGTFLAELQATGNEELIKECRGILVRRRLVKA